MGSAVVMSGLQAGLQVGSSAIGGLGRQAAGNAQALAALSRGMAEAHRLRMQSERTMGDARMGSAQQRARALGYGQQAEGFLIDAESQRIEADSIRLAAGGADIDANRMRTAAIAGRTRALQTDETVRKDMMTTLSNVDAIRASGGVSAMSPTHLALMARVREVMGERRQVAVENEQIRALDLDIRAIGETVRGIGLRGRALSSDARAASLTAQSAVARANQSISDAAADYVMIAGEKQAQIEMVEADNVMAQSAAAARVARKSGQMSMFTEMAKALPSVFSFGQSLYGALPGGAGSSSARS